MRGEAQRVLPITGTQGETQQVRPVVVLIMRATVGLGINYNVHQEKPRRGFSQKSLHVRAEARLPSGHSGTN